MRKNIYLFTIGLIFIGMLWLSRGSLLTKTLSNEDILITAVKNTFSKKSFSINGNLKLSLHSINIKEDFELNINGHVNKDKKEINIYKDNIKFNYYEDSKIIYIGTPFKKVEKLLINKPEKIKKDKEEYMNNHIKEVLEGLKSFEVIKNIPISVNNNEIKVLTNCYVIKGDIRLFEGIFKSLNIKEFQEIDINKEIEIKIYIDEELQIRNVSINFNIKDINISLEIYFSEFNRIKNIKTPDVSEAKRLNGTIEEIIMELLYHNSLEL